MRLLLLITVLFGSVLFSGCWFYAGPQERLLPIEVAPVFDEEYYDEFIADLKLLPVPFNEILEFEGQLVEAPPGWELDRKPLNISFDVVDNEDRVRGWAGCNGMWATIMHDGTGRVTLDMGPSTKVGGSREAMITEREYRKLLRKVVGYGLTDECDFFYFIYFDEGLYGLLGYKRSN